ncbi:acid-shock protein, partial [Klebsiella pneumoniae]|nr:acid-shock protein [Klebsiella pneumoniae]
MKTVLALVVAAAMGLSSADFAHDAVRTTQAPAATHSTAAQT